MISDVTPLGAIQVPSSGQPILLMADRQTTGGYTIIATVISADINLVGQLGPGDAISFVVCSLREAMVALVGRERAIMTLEGGVGS
jgi:antagonist of KipI